MPRGSSGAPDGVKRTSAYSEREDLLEAPEKSLAALVKRTRKPRKL